VDKVEMGMGVVIITISIKRVYIPNSLNYNNNISLLFNKLDQGGLHTLLNRSPKLRINHMDMDTEDLLDLVKDNRMDMGMVDSRLILLLDLPPLRVIRKMTMNQFNINPLLME
jgi:hypothetical protein